MDECSTRPLGCCVCVDIDRRAVDWRNAGGCADTTSVQEQRIEIAIRDSVYVRTKTMPILAGVPTLLVIRNEDPVRHGFALPTFVALSVRIVGEGTVQYEQGLHDADWFRENMTGRIDIRVIR